jgi:hypothetical protein
MLGPSILRLSPSEAVEEDSKRILVLLGKIGSLIQRHGHDRNGPNKEDNSSFSRRHHGSKLTDEIHKAVRQGSLKLNAHAGRLAGWKHINEIRFGALAAQ